MKINKKVCWVISLGHWWKHKLRVDSNNENSGITEEYGKSWKKPLATLDSALQLSRSNTIIFLAPGHTESMSNTINIEKPNIAIIGGNFSCNRPIFTLPERIEDEDSKTDGE